MIHRSSILLAVVAILHVATILAMVAFREWIGQIRFELREPVIIALTFGQALVVGAWATLGPLRAFVRIPAAVLWTLATSWVLVLHVGRTLELSILLCVAMLVQMLLVQLMLEVICRLTQARLGLPTALDRVSTSREYQFDIREMLVLTAVVAVFLSFSRWAIAFFEFRESNGIEWRVVVNLSLLVFCNALLALPLVWTLLLARRSAWAFVAGLAFAVGATLLEQSLFRQISQNPPNLGLLWLINGLQCLWAFVSMLLVRLAGFRLVRRGCAPGTAAEQV